MMESLRLGLDGNFLGLDTVVADVGEDEVSVVAVVGSAIERVEVECLLPGRKCEGGVSRVSRHCGSTASPLGRPKKNPPCQEQLDLHQQLNTQGVTRRKSHGVSKGRRRHTSFAGRVWDRGTS